MACPIHQLLKEGVRSHDVRNCHDQLVEAVVFAKVLSSNEAFPMCRNIYLQLHAAIPFFREAGANTGVALSGIFADETEFTPVTKLCAYIYGMLSLRMRMTIHSPRCTITHSQNMNPSSLALMS